LKLLRQKNKYEESVEGINCFFEENYPGREKDPADPLKNVKNPDTRKIQNIFLSHTPNILLGVW
jgi:hypothetical protein